VIISSIKNYQVLNDGIKGLKDNFIPISEKDIFDYFKIPYLKPKDRKIFIIPIK